ncbi:MAG: hypothetical protein HOO96_29615 [Polyangiaceae bacterium]|nr:hypothetical protein [Polyangiaceae bacterium]
MSSTSVANMSVVQLLDLCEKHLAEPSEGDEAPPEEVDNDAYLQAKKRLLGEENAEILPRARKMLELSSVEAWECGAALISRQAETNNIPRALVTEVIGELEHLAAKAPRTDPQETKAKIHAIEGLGFLRAVRALMTLAGVRFIKTGPLLDNVCAALSRAAGKPFTTTVLALKWARAHLALEKQSRAAWDAAVVGKKPEAFTAYPSNQNWSVGELLDHPKFGHGVVTKVADSLRMEILFRDGTRTLTQGQQ